MRPALVIGTVMALSAGAASWGAAHAAPAHRTSFGGDIVLDRSPEGALVRSFGGDIRVREAGGVVRATSYGGNVRVEELEGDARVTSYGGDVDLTVRGAQSQDPQVIFVHAFGGDVTVRVPPGFEAAVEIEIVESQWGGPPGEIESDLPLERTESGWHRSATRLFQKCNVLRGTRTSSASPHRIRLVSEGGSVRLLRSSS